MGDGTRLSNAGMVSVASVSVVDVETCSGSLIPKKNQQ
jgi:hypothetical protein